MAIRLQPGQGRGEEKDNDSKSNSQNYEGDNVTQNTKTITAIDSASQDSASNKKIKIIIDEPAEEDALYFKSYSENLANIIREAKPKFAIGIFGKWGTGKTTLMKMIKRELDKDNEKVLTVWFDAWRYEKEKYLAVIPFLRQIRIALEKDLAKRENGKSSRWTVLRHGLEKTFTAFMLSTEFSVSPEGSPVSTSTNLEKFYDSLKSKGSVFIDSERRQFHEHSTDYLQAALNELGDARIVVFVDDLDRCTPENAVEVIESIKAFFDIEGIVYVIGMDSESINHIIEQKYAKGSGIDGLNYLQKIVQLPFQIPVWKPQDIRKSISEIISKGLEGSKLVEEFLKDKRKELIVKAIEPNPRQVKRFVNNIILARAVFGEQIETDKLIAVQALNFRPRWNRFLELISENDNTRKTFFQKYYIPHEGKGKSIRNKDALERFIKAQSDANNPLPKEIIDIFEELIIKQNDDTLKSFLDEAGAAEILRDIDKMEDYRRALEATKHKDEKLLRGKQRPTDEQLFELLKTRKVKEFNEMRIQYPSFPNFSDASLSGANLTHANLSGAILSILLGANVSLANLTNADLSLANLTNANLTHAELTLAYLSGANLTHAELTNANFSDADLTGAIR